MHKALIINFYENHLGRFTLKFCPSKSYFKFKNSTKLKQVREAQLESLKNE